MRVLVVDDDLDQVIVRCMVLSHHGFETKRASDPQSALQAAREDVPDVVIMDLGLPEERDGLALISDLKQVHPELRVIVLTGSTIQRLRDRPELQDVEALMEKGTSCKALLHSLDRIAAALPS